MEILQFFAVQRRQKSASNVYKRFKSYFSYLLLIYKAIHETGKKKRI